MKKSYFLNVVALTIAITCAIYMITLLLFIVTAAPLDLIIGRNLLSNFKIIFFELIPNFSLVYLKIWVMLSFFSSLVLCLSNEFRIFKNFPRKHNTCLPNPS
jgi:hypothetical protein